MTSRDVYPTLLPFPLAFPTLSPRASISACDVIHRANWRTRCAYATLRLCVCVWVCGKATWNIYVLVDFSLPLSYSHYPSLCADILWRWQTATKIVMLNLHKIPREFILMSQWKYKRVEHISIRYIYGILIFISCSVKDDRQRHVDVTYASKLCTCRGMAKAKA